MKQIKLMLGAAAVLCVAAIGFMAADHIDAPNVSETSADIADYYAFRSPTNSNNMVFVATVQGLLSPGATGDASFDENVLIEFNIDNDGDNVEDLVIQVIPRFRYMYAFGPYAPSATGTVSSIDESQLSAQVQISTYGESADIGASNGVKIFAGPRDDPFFFDLGAYQDILGGAASGFSNPGNDTFAGTNVLAVVVEVPKSQLGAGSGAINTWVETKRKQ